MILLTMAIGAILNLLVAWGCVYFKPPKGMPGVTVAGGSPSAAIWNDAFGESVLVTNFDEPRSLDPAAVPKSDKFGSMMFWVQEFRDESWGCLRILLNDALRSLPPNIVIVRAGFPMHAFECRAINDTKTSQTSGGFVWQRPIKGMAGFGRYEFPYAPVLPGFAVNTMIYAFCTGLVILGVQSWRRSRRRLLNRCTACGYDLQGSPSAICPECGQSQT